MANALIGQSGGPTAVINQSLVGIVEVLREAKSVTRILGAVHGIQGVLDGRLIDLSRESRRTLERVARTPRSALRSVRHKPTPGECRAIWTSSSGSRCAGSSTSAGTTRPRPCA
jgi:6-phosphofructokinase 1